MRVTLIAYHTAGNTWIHRLLALLSPFTPDPSTPSERRALAFHLRCFADRIDPGEPPMADMTAIKKMDLGKFMAILDRLSDPARRELVKQHLDHFPAAEKVDIGPALPTFTRIINFAAGNSARIGWFLELLDILDRE